MGDKKPHKSTAFSPHTRHNCILEVCLESVICSFSPRMPLFSLSCKDQFKCKQKNENRKKIITESSKFFTNQKREKLGNCHPLNETERKMLSSMTRWPRQLLELKNESRPSEMCLHAPLCLTAISIDLTLSPALISCGLELPYSLLYTKTVSQFFSLTRLGDDCNRGHF